MVIFVQHWRVICGEYCVVVLLYHVHTVNKCGRDPTHGFEVEMSRVYPYIRSTFENSVSHIIREEPFKENFVLQGV